MKIGVIGAGRIGGNCALQAVKGGHEVKLSFSRDPRTWTGSPASSASERRRGRPGTWFSSRTWSFSRLWGAVPQALEQAGDLSGKVVVDTTNQFGSGPMPSEGQIRPNLRNRLSSAPRH